MVKIEATDRRACYEYAKAWMRVMERCATELTDSLVGTPIHDFGVGIKDNISQLASALHELTEERDNGPKRRR